ncbi:MAG TPA: Wzz/FepE/Etk N-terminal domain-containing protein [Streptosporangiaceae bacterium]
MNPGLPDSFQVADYVGVLRRRWLIVVSLTIIGLIGAFGYTAVAKKTYDATVKVSVTPTGADNGANVVQGSRTNGATVNLDTEAQVVQSDTVAVPAAKIMHSTLTPFQLIQNISVGVPPNSSVLLITCGASTAKGAADCANAFGQAYLQNRSATSVAQTQAQVRTLQSQVTSLTQQASSLNTKISGLPSNSSQRATDETILSSVNTQLKNLTSQISTLAGAGAKNSGGSILSLAGVPGKATSPKKSLILPSGLVAGLLLGLIGAFIWDRRDKKLHTARDVERLLGLPLLLNVPRKAFSQQLSLASPRSRTGQAFTELAHAVAASLGEGSHVLLVAGTTSGPGGSVVAANLAATMARTHGEVVLVCANLDDSVAPEMLGVEDGRGLSEVLAGRATVRDVARGPAGIPGLWVITPGADTSLAVYNLQHDRTQALTSQLRRDARYVIIDAQATDDGADTFALAEFADAALIAVEIPRTTRDDAAECIRRLRQLRTPVLGSAVLSAISSRVSVRPPRAGGPRLGLDDSAPSATAGRGQAELPPSAPDDRPDNRRERRIRSREGQGDPAGRVPGS